MVPAAMVAAQHIGPVSDQRSPESSVCGRPCDSGRRAASRGSMMRGRPALRPGDRRALAHTLSDDVALHLGDRGLDLPKGPAGRGRGVHGRVERAESDAALVELVGAAPEPVEDDEDEDFAAALAAWSSNTRSQPAAFRASSCRSRTGGLRWWRRGRSRRGSWSVRVPTILFGPPTHLRGVHRRKSC